MSLRGRTVPWSYRDMTTPTAKTPTTGQRIAVLVSPGISGERLCMALSRLMERHHGSCAATQWVTHLSAYEDLVAYMDLVQDEVVHVDEEHIVVGADALWVVWDGMSFPDHNDALLDGIEAAVTGRLPVYVDIVLPLREEGRRVH